MNNVAMVECGNGFGRLRTNCIVGVDGRDGLDDLVEIADRTVAHRTGQRTIDPYRFTARD